MTNEEAARILDPETSREALAEIEYYGGFCGMDAVIEASDEACRIAAEALRRGTSHASDEPLTLEQLRGMDGRDEELAKWFVGAGICIRDFDDVRCDGVSCKECRLNWLRQPAEEG